MQNLSNINIGDVIEFGRYPFWSGGDKESIKWKVLDKKDKQILVISKYCLEEKPYNNELEDVTWETCTLRKWLNQEFMDTAFSDEEKSQILLSHVPANPNPTYMYNTDPGNDTDDKVFLLSALEADRYFEGREARKPLITPYANQNGTSTSYRCGMWWLRSPGYYSNHAASVCRDGSIGYFGSRVFRGSDAVRPAMWLKINDQ